MSAELDEKTERLCRAAAERNVAGILISAQPNFAWLSCGGSNGVDLSREDGVASLLVTNDGDRFILASRIEMSRMLSEQVAVGDFEPVEFAWQDAKAEADLNARLAAQIAGGSVVRDSEIDAVIARCRYSLTPDERDRYRGLGQDASEALVRTAGSIAPGQTETEIAESLRHELGNLGMTSVVALIAADERIANFRHPVPTCMQWERRLLLVTCARRGGLIVNLSRMIQVGKVDEDLDQKTEATAYVSASLMHETRKGKTGSQLYEVAASAYEERGFAGEIDLHHQGGATGYRTRDWVAHPACSESVQPWQAFAWNPSVTGTKVEDTIIVTNDRVEMITHTDGWPDIVTVIDGESYASAGILTI